MQAQPTNIVNGCQSYRLLIERRNGAEILLLADPHRFCLPAVEIPRWERVAPHIIRALKDIWNVEAYCLFSPASKHAARNSTDVGYQVMEMLRPEARPPRGWMWTPIESLSENMFVSPNDFQTIRSAMNELGAYADGSISSLFGKPRWLQEVFGWVEQRINPLGLRRTAQFQQLNASPTFSLMRIETNGPALWFKAVGEPNLQEYSITVELAKRFSDYLPEMIGERPEWNAWLAKEAPGSHPGESSALQAWKSVGTALANLQIKSFGQTLHLVDASCRDLRLGALVELVQPFLAVMAELMEQQTKGSPKPLSRSQLFTLGAQLHDAFATLECSQIPNTLGHLDLNPGNILVHEDNCVFLDWAEAFVGHPFLTFQYLIEHLRSLRSSNIFAENKLVSTYFDQWRSFLDLQMIARTRAVTPLLAAFLYAVTGDFWRNPILRVDRDTARHLRSLTRRMKREAELLFDRHCSRKSLVEGPSDLAALARLPSCGS